MIDGVRKGVRFSQLGLAINAILATVKLVAGLIGRSHALVADAVESFSDLITSAIVWGGLTVSAKPPDEKHPYGHGKAESLAALAVGLMLAAAAVGVAVQAVRGLLGPQDAPEPFTLVVLLAVILVKETLYRRGRRVGEDIDSTAVQADAWHHRSDAITSLVALAGVTISIYAGPGFEVADEWAALAATAVIGFNAIHFMRRSASELMDAQPSDRLMEQVTASATAVEGVHHVEKVLARKMGMAYLIDMHIEVDGEMTVRRAHELAHQVKGRIRQAVPQVRDVLVHVEPHDTEHADPDPGDSTWVGTPTG